MRPLASTLACILAACASARGPSLMRLAGNQDATYRIDRHDGLNGTAVVIGADGVLLTDYHVACKGRPEIEVEVTVGGGEPVKHRARVMACDEADDLAVIRIDRTFGRVVVLGSPGDIFDGDPIYHVGYPYALGQVVGRGYVMNRDFSDKKLKVRHALLLDAPDGRGTSGAGIFDARTGKLVGLMLMAVGIGPPGQPPEMWVRVATRVDAIRRFLDRAGIPYLTEFDKDDYGSAAMEAAPEPVTIAVACGP